MKYQIINCKIYIILLISHFSYGQCICPDLIHSNSCINVYEPVCGCDNNIYSNECYASQAGVKKYKMGECGSTTGDWIYSVCNNGNTVMEDCSCEPEISCGDHPDYAPLMALYNSTNGPNWTYNNGWADGAAGTNCDPCNGWHGVSCDENDRVACLDLGANPACTAFINPNIGNNLSGTLPPELGNLSQLYSLDLSFNQLSANIPSELGNLTQLDRLYLNNNQLSGCIPTALKEAICNVENKDLTDNPLLPWLGNTDSLCMYDVQAQIGAPCVSNGFTGNIDADCNCIPSDACGAHVDYSPLMALYNSTSGPNWIDNTGWADGASGTNCDPCSGWYGIDCDGNGRVNQLTLYNNQLIGSIPPELGNLSQLIELVIWDNQLSGSIPSEVGNLSQLTDLNLTANQLTGSIPSELGNLSQLTQLSLWDNQLTGSIPPELGNLSQLIELILGDNQLSGSIPSELGNLSQLTQLNLSDNQLTGNIPSELANLSQLTQLNLSDNQLTGNIPFELANLSQLRSLRLNDNQLTGSIPSELANLNQLNWLYLYQNQLSGCIPTGLKDYICNIENKDLSNNSLLPWQGNTDSLCMYDVQNQIGAPCISNGFNGNIDVDCNCIPSDTCGAHVDYAPLMALYNSTNGANWTNNTGWADGAAGTNCDPCNGWYGIDCDDKGRVVSIELYENQLSGMIPSQLGNVYELEILDLNFNNLSGTVPNELANLKKLRKLFLVNNGLSGNIPSDLGGMYSLEKLWLFNNRFIGSIPVELGSLYNLRQLYLFNNELSGSIPPEFGALISLEGLLVNNNQLSGTIPREIGNIQNLQSLSLSGNRLSGAIPLEIGGLEALEDLFLSNNNLNGELPVELANLQNLVQLYVVNNDLEGCIQSTLNDFICSLSSAGLDKNPKLPWQGNIDSICFYAANDQIGATCIVNGFTGNIDANCNCIPSNACGAHLDYATLMALYNNTDGDNWTDKSGWADGVAGTNCDPCSGWYGIDCDDNGRVSRLALSFNQLSGSIPTELGNLSQLIELVLWDNQLTGSIPSELGNLSQLISLRMEGNQLTGNIPTELGNLNLLEVLMLDDNQLSGNIPTELANLNLLGLLSLSENQLSGCIPTAFKDYICNVEIKDLSNNPLLPWQGNADSLCMNEVQAQIGAPCNDGNPGNGDMDIILENCSCAAPCALEAITSTYRNLCVADELSPIAWTTNAVNEVEVWGLPPGVSYTFEEDTLYIIGTPLYYGNNYQYNITTDCGISYSDSILVTSLDTNYLNQTLCAGSSILVGDQVFDNTNPNGEVFIERAGACDSLVLVALNYIEVINTELNMELCESDSLIIGQTVYNSTNPSGTEILISQDGCDSIVNVNLTFYAEEMTDITSVLCPDDYLSINGNMYNANNPMGQEILTSSLGCDSVVNVNLTFYAEQMTDIDSVLCPDDSLSINGNIYNANNPMGQEILTSSLGCDSIVNVNLTFYAEQMTDIDSVLCPDDSLSINGNIYNANNPMGQEILTSSFGCDSIVNVNLTFYAEQMTDIASILCPDESLSINGNIYNANNPIGQEILTSSLGCDSVVNVNLTFYTEQMIDIASVLCPDDSLSINGNIYNANNPIGQEILTSSFGCDSIINIELSYLDPIDSYIDTTICDFDTIIVNGVQYNSNYVMGSTTLTGQSGCDSMVYVAVQLMQCDTLDCDFTLYPDSISISLDELFHINLLENDALPDTITTQLTQIPESVQNINYSVQGELYFEVNDNFFEPLELIYEVCTADCECKQMSLFIINEELEEIVPTNVFTPNGDGNNDQLRFTQRDIIPDSELWIYNRWGDRIFHMKDYDNSWTADGYPSGIYYYVLEVRGNILKKTLTIVR